MDEKELLISKILSWRSFKYILGTIFLGALGSGLWDLFLSDLLYKSASMSARLFASIFSFYVENLHKNIGRGFNEESSLVLFLLIIIVIIIITVLLLITSFRFYSYLKSNLFENNKNQDIVKVDPKTRLIKFKKKLVYYFFATIIIVFMYSTIIFNLAYEHRAIVFVERSLEIVAPHVSNTELLLLRAKYRSINTANDFYKLEDELRSVAHNNHIILPDFSSIRP